jgi:putative transposase
MPYRNHDLGTNFYYHVFNRGVDKQVIFYEREHFSICMRLIQKYLRIYSIELLAWCLMPNHYHFILRTEEENEISLFMQTLFNAYVQALNRIRKRRGPLFEGRFKHVLVSEQNYLLHLCRYIHLNPVKAGLVRMPHEWFFSDYLEWIGAIQADSGKARRIHEFFGSFQKYKEFTQDIILKEDAAIPCKYLLE